MRQPKADVFHFADGLAEIDRVAHAVLILDHDQQTGQIVGDQALGAESDRPMATPTSDRMIVTALLSTEPMVRARCSRRCRPSDRSRCRTTRPRPGDRDGGASPSPPAGSSTCRTTRVMARLATQRTTTRTAMMSAIRSGIPMSASVWSWTQPDHGAAGSMPAPRSGSARGSAVSTGVAPFLGVAVRGPRLPTVAASKIVDPAGRDGLTAAPLDSPRTPRAIFR